MSLARRLMFGGGSVTLPPSPEPFVVSGPYDPGLTVGATVLTQLHCHTTASDGSYSPAAVVADYLAEGYGSLQLTDHDKVTAQPAGITTPITASELTSSGPHIISIDSDYVRGATSDPQAILDGIAATGGKAHIAHPKWLAGATAAQMAGWTDYLGLEIHNAKCVGGTTSNPVTFPGFAIDRWDQVLTTHRRDAWGFAVDDLHNINAFLTYDVGRVQVFVPSNTAANVVASLAAGHFVADVSNLGVTPGYPVRTADDVSVDCPGAVRIEAWGPSGLIAAVDADAMTYAFEGTESYVRLVAIGDYTEPFSGALPRHWQAYNGSWAVSGGTLRLAGSTDARHMILCRHREGDFEAKVDIKLGSGGMDAALLLFNVLNANYWYGLRIGESATAGFNNKLAALQTTNGGANQTLLASYPFVATAGTWYTVSMAYTAATGLIRAKVWERSGTEPVDWQLSVASTTWRDGMFGFRANYTPEFDNLYVKGFRTYFQPIAIDPT